MTAAPALLCALYLADLTGMGMVGPGRAALRRCRPRHGAIRRLDHAASVGPAMVRKTGVALLDDGGGVPPGPRPGSRAASAGRAAELVFLGFFWWRLKLEWGGRAASYATAMLATSAGWLTYSHVAVTDLAAGRVLLGGTFCCRCPGWQGRDRTTLAAAAACLGLAALAKGLVPLVLFLPVLGNWLAALARLAAARTHARVLGLRIALVYALHDAKRERVSARVLSRAAVRPLRLRRPAARAAGMVLFAGISGPALSVVPAASLFHRWYCRAIYGETPVCAPWRP